jgi:hypothetical protein
MKAKTKIITVRVSQETADRCERLRLAGAHSAYMDSAFARVIFNIGLDKYEKTILPIETGKEYQPLKEIRLQAASCETAPEAVQRPETKIIPFPGVSLNQGDDFQNGLDDFLREIGYVE